MASLASMRALNSLQKSEGDCLSCSGSRDPKNTRGATMVDVGCAAIVKVVGEGWGRGVWRCPAWGEYEERCLKAAVVLKRTYKGCFSLVVLKKTG